MSRYLDAALCAKHAKAWGDIEKTLRRMRLVATEAAGAIAEVRDIAARTPQTEWEDAEEEREYRDMLYDALAAESRCLTRLGREWGNVTKLLGRLTVYIEIHEREAE
jgi:hypothetical protein